MCTQNAPHFTYTPWLWLQHLKRQPVAPCALCCRPVRLDALASGGAPGPDNLTVHMPVPGIRGQSVRRFLPSVSALQRVLRIAPWLQSRDPPHSWRRPGVVYTKRAPFYVYALAVVRTLGAAANRLLFGLPPRAPRRPVAPIPRSVSYLQASQRIHKKRPVLCTRFACSWNGPLLHGPFPAFQCSHTR